MAEKTYPIPANMAEASAAEGAAAAFFLTRIEALEAVLNGPEAEAFEQAMAAEVAIGVPNGTSAAANIPSLTNWFSSIRAGLQADKMKFSATISAASPTVDDGAGA